MKPRVTVRQNVERVLAHLGLSGEVAITSEVEDRVYAWPVGGGLRRYVTEAGWSRDCKVAAEHFHGEASESFREPSGCHPALQVVFHPDPYGEFLEIDLDESNPHADVVGMVWHGIEVLTNTLWRRKTNQERIAALLDKRFGKEAKA